MTTFGSSNATGVGGFPVNSMPQAASFPGHFSPTVSSARFTCERFSLGCQANKRFVPVSLPTLVPWGGFHNKVLQTEGLQTTETDSLPVLEARVSDRGVAGAVLPLRTLGEGPSCLSQFPGLPAPIGFWSYYSSLCLQRRHMASSLCVSTWLSYEDASLRFPYSSVTSS